MLRLIATAEYSDGMVVDSVHENLDERSANWFVSHYSMMMDWPNTEMVRVSVRVEAQ